MISISKQEYGRTTTASLSIVTCDMICSCRIWNDA